MKSTSNLNLIFWIFVVQLLLPIGYAVLSSGLVFMIPELFHIRITDTNKIVGNFIALMYLLNLIGGLILNKLISPKHLLLIGGVLQAIGFLLLIHSYFLFIIGLSLYALGFGFAIPCINILLMEQVDKTKLDRAFFWNYSFVCIGYTIGFIISGIYIPIKNFSLLIELMFLLYILFSAMCYFKIRLNQEIKPQFLKIILIILFSVAFSIIFLYSINLASFSMLVIGLTGFIYIGYKAKLLVSVSQRDKLWLFNGMSLCVLLFWSLSLLSPMGIMLFLASNVSLKFLGFNIAPQWVRSMNMILIVIISPIISYIIEIINKRETKLNYSGLFGLGLIFTGFGFLILALGIFQQSTKIDFSWILLFTFFTTLGRVFFAPASASIVNKLVPIDLKSFANSFILLLSGVASVVAIFLSNFIIIEHNNYYAINNSNVVNMFVIYGNVPLFVGIILLVFSFKYYQLISKE